MSDPRLFQMNGADVTVEYRRDAAGALYVAAVVRNRSVDFEKTFGPVAVLSESHAEQWLASKVAKYGFPLGRVQIAREHTST